MRRLARIVKSLNLAPIALRTFTLDIWRERKLDLPLSSCILNSWDADVAPNHQSTKQGERV